VIRGEWADLAKLTPGLISNQWEIQPAAGVELMPYLRTLQSQLGSAARVSLEEDNGMDRSFALFLAVVAMLGAVLVAISLGGVLNTVLLETRQRARELAVLKALGLTPRGVIGMVTASVLPLAALAGLIGVPLGIVSQHAVLGFMAEETVRSGIPPSIFDVFGAIALVGLACSGLAIGVAGAYLPATRAASGAIAPVLQAE
jgi:putative ABC transport system permease protein